MVIMVSRARKAFSAIVSGSIGSNCTETTEDLVALEANPLTLATSLPLAEGALFCM